MALWAVHLSPFPGDVLLTSVWANHYTKDTYSDKRPERRCMTTHTVINPM